MHEGHNVTYINGEIWTVEDSIKARQSSGCVHLMLGRGALASPDLARRILDFELGQTSTELPWLNIVELVEAQFLRSDSQSPRHIGNRTKQWLAYLKRSYAQANDLFARMRTLHSVADIQSAFDEHRRWCTV